MKALHYVLTLCLVVLTSLPALAQPAQADFMRSMGKMYVVVAVIVTIFLGIVFFLVFLDRRLTRIENQIKNHE